MGESEFSVINSPSLHKFEEVIVIENEELSRFWETKKMLFVEMLMWEEDRRRSYLDARAARLKLVAETIAANLAERVTRGKDEALFLIRYIKSVARSLTDYAESLRSQLGFLPPPKSAKRPNSLKSGLAALAEYQTDRIQLIRSFAAKLEEDLIQGGLAITLMDYERRTHVAQVRIVALLTQLGDCETTVKSRFEEHTSAFRELEAELSQGRHARKCTWLTESRFLSAVQHETVIRQTLAQALQSWSIELLALDSARCAALKTHMMSFLSLQASLFLTLPETPEVTEILEAVITDPPEYKFLTNEESEALKLVAGDSDPFHTMREWTPRDAPRTPLTIKSGNLMKEAGVFRQWHSVFAVLTSTHFLHLFASSDLEPFPDPLLSIFLSQYKVFVSGDDFVFDLVETRSSGLMSLLSSPSLYTFKADSAETMNEWMQLLTESTLSDSSK